MRAFVSPLQEAEQAERGMDEAQPTRQLGSPRLGAEPKRPAQGHGQLAGARQSHRLRHPLQGSQDPRARGQGLDLRHRGCKLRAVCGYTGCII